MSEQQQGGDKPGFFGSGGGLMDKKSVRIISFTAGILLLVLGILFSGHFPQYDDHFGFWSVVPPLVAIFLAFAIRDVISALFIGICLGGIISGKLDIVGEFLIPSIGSESYGQILLVYLWALGGLIGVWSRTAGAIHFAEWAAGKIVRGRRSAMFFAWLMGLVFHQGGTVSTVLTGATVRPVNDKQGVSHEELSYVVDSTASPAATIIPFNVWPIFVGGLVAGTVPMLETEQDGINFFFQAIPFNFFAIFAIIITLFFALEKLPFVPGRKMREAIQRVKETGKLDRDGAQPLAAKELEEVNVPEGYRPGLLDFFGPIGMLIGVAMIPYFYSMLVLGMDDPWLFISQAFVLAVLTGMLIALAKGMNLKEVMDGFVDGCKGVTIGAIILGLAVTLQEVAEQLGTANYVIEVAGDVVPAVLPAVLMAICMVMAFATGTSWGTYAVVFPVAMPLAWAVAGDEFFLLLCFSAVVGGSVFGDKISPISDTTILSSLATGCDLMDHVYTQMPLAFAAAIPAALVYTVLVILFV